MDQLLDVNNRMYNAARLPNMCYHPRYYHGRARVNVQRVFLRAIAAVLG